MRSSDGLDNVFRRQPTRGSTFHTSARSCWTHSHQIARTRFATVWFPGKSCVAQPQCEELKFGNNVILRKDSAPSLDLAMDNRGQVLTFALIFRPDFLDLPSIARLPRSARGFFLFRHFGFQAAVASSRQSFP